MRALLTALAISSAAFAIGCAVDEAVDCNDICNRYRDCFDNGYDTASCRDRCQDVADRDRGAADACDACLDDSSCTGSFTCAGDCSGIIP